MAEKQALNKISEEIISRAAMKAALSVSGVNHLNDTLADNITKKIAGKDPVSKGIKVSRDKDCYTIDVFIVADFGTKIPELAWDIQTAIKKHISKVTNKKINAVNIHIQGVALPKKTGRTNE